MVETVDHTDAPRRRRRHARPRELLDAALALSIEKGFAATKTDEIAARAGVSKGTLYVYFHSKDALLQALIAEGFSSRFPMEEKEPTDDIASQDLLRDVLSAWRFALMEGGAGGMVKLVYMEVNNFPELAASWSREVIEPACRRVARVVVRGIDRGEFRPVDPEVVVRALVLPIIVTCLHQQAMAPSAPPDALTDGPDLFSRHFEFVLEGLVRRTP